MSSNGAHDFTISMVPHGKGVNPVETTMRSAVKMVADGKWKTQTEMVRDVYERALNGPIPEDKTPEEHAKNAAAPYKLKLPAFLFSGTFSYRRNEDLIQHSGLICCDLDKIGAQLASYRDLIIADPHTLAAFVSPTGTGLKVIFRCDPTKPHLESFYAAERFMLERFGLAIDGACNEVARLCYASHDPDAFLANDAEPLPYPEKQPDVPEEFIPPSSKHDTWIGLKPGDDYDNKVDPLPILLAHGWTRFGREGLCRPGKTGSSSATWNHVPNRLYVFSSSTPFTPHKLYRPWHIYAVLECGGDFGRAPKELYAKGYGDRVKPKVMELEDWDTRSNGVHPADQEVSASGAASDAKLLAEAAPLLFDFTKQIARPRSIFTLGGTQISTPGNLGTLFSQAKTGKSATIGGMLAATLVLPGQVTHDTLGFAGPNPQGHVVLHFDTEQSGYDWQQLLLTALRRAGHEGPPPPWLQSYHLTGVHALKCRAMVDAVIRDAAQKFGGIHSVIIDGVADLVIDPNDAEECFPVVTSLHATAIKYDTAIISVLHMNPGSDVKGRGHLGSQLERKSESNLVLTKDGDVTSITSAKQRGKAINKDDAPSFRWSDEHQMHVSCGTPQSVQKKKGGRAEKWAFSTYKSCMPKKGDAPMLAAHIAQRCVPNGPLPDAQKWQIVARWADEGFLECIDAPTGKLYRMAL